MTKTKKNNESLFAMPLYCAPFTNQRFVRGKKILTRALYLPVLVLLLASKKHGNYRSKICTSNSKVSKVLVPSAREHSEISKGATCVTAKVESKEKHSEHATILQIVSKIKKTIDKKKLILSSSNLLITISGGQDSIFLLFCFFFLQSQLDFCIKIVWCNHFWQIDSFYTTLHLTKTAQAFSSPVIGFIPLHLELESKTVQSADLRKYRSACPYPCSFLPLYSAPFTNQRFVYPERNPVRAKGNTFFDPSLLTPKRDKYNQVFFLPLLKSSILTGTRSKSLIPSTWCPCEPKVHGSHGSLPYRHAKKVTVQCNNLKRKTFLKKEKKFIEALSEGRARNWRHITIERASTFYNRDRCVYGHSSSDRVETILFNLIRGTGKKGATSLRLKRRHSLFCYNKFYPCLEQLEKNTHINNC